MTPVVLFAYARPDHTEATLKALIQNHRVAETELVVFCDGARTPEVAPKVQETRDRIRSILTQTCPFAAVEVIERRENWGLTQSIIQGIDTVIRKTGRVIVVEDDIVTSPHFIPYHLDALDYYQSHSPVFFVSGYAPSPHTQPLPMDYPYDVYFNQRNSAWGWSTWLDRWQKMDFAVSDYDAFKNDLSQQLAFNRLGEDVSQMLYHQQERGLDTWDIQTSYSMFKNHGVALCPRYSFVNNIGLDNTGEHCGEAQHLQTDLALARPVSSFPKQVYVDERIMDSFRTLHARPYPGLIGKGAQTYWESQRTSKDNSRLSMAQTYLENGDFKQAKTLLDEHLQCIPGDPAANTLMGHLALSLKQMDSALDCFRFALLTHADYVPALQGAAAVLKQRL